MHGFQNALPMAAMRECNATLKIASVLMGTASKFLDLEEINHLEHPIVPACQVRWLNNKRAFLRPVQTDQTCWSNIIKQFWTQDIWPFWTALKIILVGYCWTVLDDIISCLVLTCTEIQHCRMVLDMFEHSSVQHNPTLIKHRPTPPNNVG